MFVRVEIRVWVFEGSMLFRIRMGGRGNRILGFSFLFFLIFFGSDFFRIFFL